MRRMTRTAILAAVCVVVLVGGNGAGAQPRVDMAIKSPSGAAPAEPAAPAAAQVARDLEGELDEASGLPVPRRRTLVTGEKGPYRNSVHVETPLDLSVVLRFYRAVLNKRGWTEEPQHALVEADRAELAFATAA